MKDCYDPDHDDLLERAFRSLDQIPLSDGPPPETVAELVAAVQIAANRPRTLTFKERIFTMKPIFKTALAATVLLAFGGLFAWMITSGSGASVALADVADVLDKIRSATWKITVETEGKPPRTAKGMYVEPGRRRVETSQGMVMIFGESKMVTLVPKKELAIVCTIQNAPTNGLSRNWLEDLRKRVREAASGSEGDVEELGRRKVDGRDAVGFRVRIKGKEMSVWADPETALPIRVEGTSGIMKPKRHHVMSDFRYNVDLDESLFSLKAPKGYTEQQMSMDASTPKERDLIEILRVYTAEQENGLLPPTLDTVDISRGVTGRIGKEMAAKYGTSPEAKKKAMQGNEFKEYMELAKKLGRGLGFLHELQPENDCHYAGSGVKLGTPDRPILWYKPTGADKYRVIYADLSVKELAPEDLKKLPEAKPQ